MEPTIVFTGGGTGGHIFPGLAVIEYIRERWDGRIVWVGSGSELEQDIVRRWNIPFFAIPSGKLRRYLSLKNFTDLFRITAGVAASVSLLRKLKPALVFSKGGFVSVPPVLAAKLLGIPVFTHESDLDPGLATKINARFAERVFVAYDETVKFFPGELRKKVAVSGNPVRQDVFTASRERGRSALVVPEEKQVLLVLGGSQGARELNLLVQETLPELSERFFVVHQRGRQPEPPAAAANYFPVDFLGDEYADYLAAADLVVGRSGAGTLWELAALGKPSVLVPLAGAGTRGDQLLNARLFRDRGAARVLEPGERTGRAFLEAVKSVADAPSTLAAMGTAAAGIGSGNAVKTLGEAVIARAGERLCR